MFCIVLGQSSKFSTPKKSLKRESKKRNLDDFDKGVLKRVILNLHLTEKTLPTVKTILPKFKDATGYDGGRETLRLVIRDIGFRWRKSRTNRKILTERNDIQHLRVNYLKSIKNYREAGRPIIYLDETYIHASHTKINSWDDDTNRGLLKPVSTGHRLIIVNAGGENGFIPGANLIFKSNLKSGNYHHEMNFENFSKWVNEKLIPNLPPKSVLVIDNAPYHNVQVNKPPNSNSTKETMKNWLREKNILFNDNMLKCELYNLIKLHKPKYRHYAIDDLLTSHGHNVLRLPPYHPDLNPIELVWASLKQFVASRNVTFKLEAVKELCEEFFTSFSVNEWKSRCDHAKKCEDEFFKRDFVIDSIVDNFIINLAADSSDETDASETDEELSGIEDL